MKKVKNDKFNKCREFGGQGCPPYDIMNFLLNQKCMRYIITALCRNKGSFYEFYWKIF